MQGSGDISEEELKRATKAAARIVMYYGDTYIRIFERLHKELMKSKEKEDAMLVAFNIVKMYVDLDENE